MPCEKTDYSRKKVLLLGGSHFQVPSITTVKKLGHYAVTCDYIPNNPGHKLADESYNISTTDREAVLKLAKKLCVDAVVCYASDPAAPTAAWVCEQMGLPTSPYESVEILSNKDKYRAFLDKNGFHVPKAKGFHTVSEAEEVIDGFQFPVMVKPVDSSGSKGVSKINNPSGLETAAGNALKYSRCKRFLVEEYVHKKGYQLDGDGFSVNGKLQFRCFGNEHFDAEGLNPFVPVGESFPYQKPAEVQGKIHAEIQRLLTLLKMGTQAYNFEARVDKEGKVYLMEVGPRNGGNLIPQVTRYATGVDMVEYTVRAALGEDCSGLAMAEPKGYWSSYMLHSRTGGILREIKIDDSLYENNVVEHQMFCKVGDRVEPFTGSNGTIGTMILKYRSREEMLEKMDFMEKWIRVVVE